MPKYLAGLVAAFVALPTPSGRALPHTRPALARMRVVLTTESSAADLRLEPGTILDTAVAFTARSARASHERNHLSFTANDIGLTETQLRVLVVGIREQQRVRWRLELRPPTRTRVEIYNENDEGRPRLVDRFDTDAAETMFESPSDRLLAGGPLRIAPGPPPLVLAFYYPWYFYATWSSHHLRDQPLSLYSTENPDEVANSLREARTAGLDGVIVSWIGNATWNDRRLRIVLDQAQALGLKVSILVETLSAVQPQPDGTDGLDADKMRRWLEKAFDVHAPHPAFLKVRGRPVIFVYVADGFAPDQWRAMAQSLRQSGRNIFLMADSLDPTLLESFSGAFTYATATLPEPDLPAFYAEQALRTQGYNLLHGRERRLDAATVSPGYDDSLLARDAVSVVDRADGALYAAQWQAATSAQPDWLLVTTWNEFYENTHIEPSVLFDHRYQDRTRAWSRLFHASGRTP